MTPGREFIELGDFGVLEDGVLRKTDKTPEKAEEVVTDDQTGTVEETDPDDEDGKEENK